MLVPGSVAVFCAVTLFSNIGTVNTVQIVKYPANTPGDQCNLTSMLPQVPHIDPCEHVAITVRQGIKQKAIKDSQPEWVLSESDCVIVSIEADAN